MESSSSSCPEIHSREDRTPEFVSLLMAHERELRRYIQALVSRRDDAEEVMQQTALVLWEKFSEYDSTRQFMPWAKRIGYFEALNFRKHKARSRLIFSEEIMEAVAETLQETSELCESRAQLMKDCVAKLPKTDRELLEFRYAESKTIKSVALGGHEDARHLYRRLEKIRERLLHCIDHSFRISPFAVNR